MMPEREPPVPASDERSAADVQAPPGGVALKTDVVVMTLRVGA